MNDANSEQHESSDDDVELYVDEHGRLGYRLPASWADAEAYVDLDLEERARLYEDLPDVTDDEFEQLTRLLSELKGAVALYGRWLNGGIHLTGTDDEHRFGLAFHDPDDPDDWDDAEGGEA